MRVSQQIGWSQESKLIYNIIRQLEKLEIVWDHCCTTTSTSSTTTTTSTTLNPGLTMTVGNNPRFDIPADDDNHAGDFTIECWAKITADDNNPRLWSIGSFLTHALSIDNGNFRYFANGTEITSIDISGYSYIGQWTHFCVSRFGDGFGYFINGVRIGGNNQGIPIPTNGYPLYIGSKGNDSVVNGYMSNFRWNNTAVYSSGGFTPPTTPLTAISGTQLLILQGDTLPLELTDNSGVTPPNTIANATASYFVDNPFVGEVGCTQFGIVNIPIGIQVWSNKNLDVDHYRNGDPIPEVTDPTEWAALTTGAWCWYNNDSSNDPTYGKLYNWYAVNDPRGLAPIGYHIPTQAEWLITRTYLGPTTAGGEMKEIGTLHWNSPNTGATNNTRFTALPGGLRYNDGTFGNIGNIGDWWSSTEISGGNICYFDMQYSTSTLYAEVNNYKNLGLSVRLIKD